MKTLNTKYVLCLLIPVLAGCHTMHKPGFPRQSFDETKTIRQLEGQFPASLVTDYYLPGKTEADRRDLRDRIIDGRLALIDLNYNQFVAQFSVTRESIDFTAEIAELGLNLATTAVGSAATKTTLAAISAGVTGSKLAVDKNFFFEKTVPVLVGSMNAQRKIALIPILKGVQLNADTYHLTQALADLDNYYQAGTFVGALQSIQAESGVKEKDAKDQIDTLQIREAFTTGQVAALDKLKKVFSALNAQTSKGDKKIADANQKEKLAQAIKPFLGKKEVAADDPGLVAQFHRLYQSNPEHSEELLKSLKDSQYPNLPE